MVAAREGGYPGGEGVAFENGEQLHADVTPCTDEARAGGEIVPFDDGSLTADKAQSSAMSLVVNYAAPEFAAGVAVFGLGLLVLPLLARLGLRSEAGVFSYSAHCQADVKPSGSAVRLLLTEPELKRRLGHLDAAFVAEEITMATEDIDDHIRQCDPSSIEDEVSQLQSWRDKANTNLKALQKRSALAFMGLPPDAGDADVGKMYKKMALELHPDKGGDPDKFQELQEMKERLVEIEKDDEQRKDMTPEDEEARRAKEREKELEDDEGRKLPPCERMKRLRMDVHDNAVRLWERARKSKDEIVGDKAIKSNPEKAVNLLKVFVDRFVSSEVKTLRHGDVRTAEAKLRKFVKQGAEIIAVAAMHDVQTTLSTLAMHFNYRIVSRSGSPEIKAKCANLLEAVAEVPTSAEAFLADLDSSLAGARDRVRQGKEVRAAEQRAREAAGDYSGEAEAPKSEDTHLPSAARKPEATDPFFDFDVGPAHPTTAGAPGQLTRKAESRVVESQKPKVWDPNFDHPYAGAMYSNGKGIFCRPCQRWITTYDYNVDAFHTHVERVHPKPPLGWVS